jgi:hypothetical protein
VRIYQRARLPVFVTIKNYLYDVLGSASELQYFLLLARDLQLLQGGDYDRLAEKTTEVKRMLGGFLQKLKAAGWALKALQSKFQISLAIISSCFREVYTTF